MDLDQPSDAPSPSGAHPGVSAPTGAPLPPVPSAPSSGGSDTWSDLPSWSSTGPTIPQPAPPPKKRWPMLVGVLAAAVAVVVVVLLVTGGGGSSLPDTLGGSERVDSGPVADMLEQFGDMEFAGVHLEMAVYGAGLTPDYMVVLLDGDVPLGDPESFMTSFASGFASQGGTLDMDRAVNEQVGDTEYLCAPTAGTPTAGLQQELSVCVFVGSGSSGVVMAFDAANLQSLLGTTKELHEALA